MVPVSGKHDDSVSEFLTGVWKGLFPRLLPFFLLGLVFRIARGQWTRADSLLLALFAAFDLLAAFQIPMFYRLLFTSSRYLLIGAVLYFPFAALGMYDTWRILRRWFLGRLLAATVFLLLVAASLYDLYSPLLIEYSENSKKGIERRIALAAADWIRADWALAVSGDKAFRPVPHLKCDQYQSGRRPLVLSSDWNRIGWLAGGQMYPDFLRTAEVLPDYVVTHAPADLPSMRLVHTDTILDTDYYIYQSPAPTGDRTAFGLQTSVAPGRVRARNTTDTSPHPGRQTLRAGCFCFRMDDDRGRSRIRGPGGTGDPATFPRW